MIIVQNIFSENNQYILSYNQNVNPKKLITNICEINKIQYSFIQKILNVHRIFVFLAFKMCRHILAFQDTGNIW